MASRVIVALRWFVVAGWIAGAVIATIMLPGLGGSSDLELPLPSDAAPLKAEARSAEIFGSPLLTRTQVVVSRQGGLSASEQRDLAEFALRVSQHKVVGLTDIQAAVPLTSAGGVAPGAEPGPASVITYLAFGPGTSVAHQTRVARDYAAVAPVPQGARADLTGTYPTQQEQMETIDDKLPLVVGVTLALIVLVVALVFRSVVAPLVVLGTIGVAYAIDLRAIGAVGEAIGITATRDIEPVVSALLMGIVTDYAIFYLFGVRNRLRDGDARSAAIGAGAQMTAIVITAGLTTALGTAVLLVGDVDFFRAFAPALALTAVTGVVVSVTLLPALLAILGRAAFWPGGVPAEERGPRHRVSRPPLAMRLLTNRAVAVVSVLVLIGALVMAALPLRNLELGLGLTSRLAPEARSATGFAPGVTAPTEILVEGPGATDPAFLQKFEAGLDGGPGVADVLGPADPLPQLAPSVFVSQQAGASRFVVVFDTPPTEHRAIQDYRALEERLPGLVSSAGAPDAQVGVSGDTAIASASVDAMQTELLRVGSAALVINFLLLAAFLRALVAPLYLLVANALTVAATLGITTWFFQDHLGEGQLVYYVPFATAVLLLALGSDYNIYLVGGIWRAGRRLGLVEGIRTAMPAASVSISVAGLILAGSFGLLALVPVDALRQFAFVMALGVGLDTFVVRPFLVPSLITLFGRTGFWPGRPAPEPEPDAEAIPPRDPSAPASAPAGPR
ncbi:MAG TPA: MMPL family transporter [Miltoncostaea sp.]|nr:MMPL family transporter [Miltoncostaea sp.]